MYSQRITKGFTLAEVLITLGIIGVVAAMTLPAIIGNYRQKATLTQLKKVYTTLNQALLLSENDNGKYEFWVKGSDMDAEKYIDKYWKPYFKTIKTCKGTCGYKSIIPWNSLKGTSEGVIHVFRSDLRIPFYLNDGTFVSISSKIGNDLSTDENIYVDINGAKPPNRYASDFFVFVRTNNGIKAACYDKTEAQVNAACSLKSNTINDAFCCMQKIINDDWQIKSDYPWF